MPPKSLVSLGWPPYPVCCILIPRSPWSEEENSCTRTLTHQYLLPGIQTVLNEFFYHSLEVNDDLTRCHLVDRVSVDCFDCATAIIIPLNWTENQAFLELSWSHRSRTVEIVSDRGSTEILNHDGMNDLNFASDSDLVYHEQMVAVETCIVGWYICVMHDKGRQNPTTDSFPYLPSFRPSSQVESPYSFSFTRMICMMPG